MGLRTGGRAVRNQILAHDEQLLFEHDFRWTGLLNCWDVPGRKKKLLLSKSKRTYR